MDVTKFHGRKNSSKGFSIKEIAYSDSDDSELASDSDTEKKIFSISSAKNKIIPETDSESEDEAVHNGTHQETREDATSQSDMEEEEGNENGNQARAIGIRQRNKKNTCLEQCSYTNDQAYFAMEGRQRRKFSFSRPCNFLLQATGW